MSAKGHRLGVAILLLSVLAAAPAHLPAGSQLVPDIDRDGVPDATDMCPNLPEDGIGDATDGCPSPRTQWHDSDRDGIADGVDECPLSAEVYNGIEDA
ncbi:MAG: thrombospondin, partial [Thaumarchaeota archaeon S15]